MSVAAAINAAAIRDSTKTFIGRSTKEVGGFAVHIFPIIVYLLAFYGFSGVDDRTPLPTPLRKGYIR